MKPYVLLLGIVLSFASFAQSFGPQKFDVPSGTLDGRVRITSQEPLASDVKWVRVYITGNGKVDDSFYAVNGGDIFDHNISLRYGPGQYKFMIMTSNMDAKINGNYLVREHGVFFNSNRQVLDAIDPSCDVQSDHREIIELAQRITRDLETDLEKTKAIHDWVATNIAYDADSYFDGSYVDKPWDAVSVLRSRKAICFGYSNLTAALNRAIGIQAKVITGDAKPGSAWTPHAWNRVLIDGKWIAQDTTWDAGKVNFTTRKFSFSYKDQYFNPDDEVFALNHRDPEE